MKDLARRDVATREIKRATRGANFLTLVVQGHHIVERFLSLAINHVVPVAEFAELGRLSFPARIDLAIALRQLRKEFRPSIVALNKLRNRFAHNPYSRFSAKNATDMRNSFSRFQRDLIWNAGKKRARNLTPRETIKWCVVSLCAELRSAAVARIREKVSSEVTMFDIKDVLDSLPKELSQSTMVKHNEAVRKEMQRLLGE